MDYSNNNFEDVDVEYLGLMHLDKMNNLIELSLNLGDNEIGNKGFFKLWDKMKSLINLKNLSLEI